MQIAITREPSFEVPKGKYRATLKNVLRLQVGRAKRVVEDQVRLLFAVHVPESVDKQYLAGKNYEPSLVKGSDLRRDLAAWRGHDFTEDEIRIGTIDLKSMIGQEADLVIGHSQNDEFVKPFVHIKAIRPPGKLVKLNSITSKGGEGFF